MKRTCKGCRANPGFYPYKNPVCMLLFKIRKDNEHEGEICPCEECPKPKTWKLFALYYDEMWNVGRKSHG